MEGVVMEWLSLIAIIGMVAGGLLIIGLIAMYFFGYIDWMNRGSH